MARCSRNIPISNPAGAAYVRERDLPRLAALWPQEAADTSPEGLTRTVARLLAALRRERRLGLAGHWSYDLARHRALLLAAHDEQVRLSAAMSGIGSGSGGEQAAERSQAVAR